ncbi:MAG: zinc ribbon domain-containing protein [Anaerolineae bacterium]
MKRFFSKIGGVFLRFFLRHWTGMLIVILSLLALLTAHQMWRGGLFLALSLLPQLVTNLILIVAVFAIRHLIHLWKSGAAREILLESLSQGQTMLKGTAEGVKGALSSLTEDLKGELGEIIGGQQSKASPIPSPMPRCPSYNRFVPVGAKFCDHCGAALPATCSRCGRAVRPRAKFCDSCGAPINPSA